MSDPCSCGGSRHIRDEKLGAWVPCSCLLAKRSSLRYRKAGVPQRFEAETWKTFLARYKVEPLKDLMEIAKTLKGGGQPSSWVLIHGRPPRARDLARSLIVRASCDGALRTDSVDLPSLIDGEFSEGRGAATYAKQVLSITVGGEPNNKWNRHVLEKAVRTRWSRELFTLLVCEVDPSRLSTMYRSGLLEEALGSKFLKVRVGDLGE